VNADTIAEIPVQAIDGAVEQTPVVGELLQRP
jgi:hypothetical protein